MVEWVGYLQVDAKYGMLLICSVCILSWVVGAFAVGQGWRPRARESWEKDN